MFSLIVSKKFLFKGRLVLGPAQQVPVSERVKFSVTKQKNVPLLLKLITDCLTSLGGFEWFLTFFDFV